MYQKQRGATMWQWLFVGGMVGVFLYVGMRLTPAYIQNMAVKKALTNLNEVGSVSMSKADIKRRIMSQFNVDNVTNAEASDIKIKQIKGGKKRVTIDYEFRVELIDNISLVVDFKNSTEI
ncbi:MAG: DUF4845 domain-containing protein [Kangiellaceae bacterium]|jgi:hypothetical protein|nr:DUF4845 domain-containing protein [Kangiellaceae bacterium]